MARLRTHNNRRKMKLSGIFMILCTWSDDSPVKSVLGEYSSHFARVDRRNRHRFILMRDEITWKIWNEDLRKLKSIKDLRSIKYSNRVSPEIEAAIVDEMYRIVREENDKHREESEK